MSNLQSTEGWHVRQSGEHPASRMQAKTLEGSAPFGQSRRMIQSKSLVSLQYCPFSIRQAGVLFLTLVCGLIVRSSAGEPPAPKKVATVEGITEYQFDNGLRLLLFPDNSRSKVSVNMTV